ncbi:ferredoxin [Mycobacterium sp. WMMD1722]|uniref:ferredoxin n=1 Tax=Mycobacterium sp. WMMD1722 TaxID=3404117 RepID=UPI003BF5DD49
MRVRLDRTMCDGFGICARHASAYFSLDDWGYAALVGNGTVPPADEPAVRRALLDCPVHAIIEMAEDDSGSARPLQPPSGDDRRRDDDGHDRGLDHAEARREAQMMPGM